MTTESPPPTMPITCTACDARYTGAEVVSPVGCCPRCGSFHGPTRERAPTTEERSRMREVARASV